MSEAMWSEGDVNANGIWLHYYRTGGKKPPLLMAHGLTDNGRCWSPLSRALEAEYDLIMVDARGHGMSDAPEQGYTSREHAADYAEVIRSLKLGQPAMIGHSMGAATTAFLAATYPELIACALLEDPPWRPLAAAAAPEQRIQMAEEWRKNVVANRQQSEAALIAGVQPEHPTWSAEELEPWAQAKRQNSPKVIDYVRYLSPHWAEYVAAIPCPTLLLIADTALGGIVSAELAQEAVALNPKLRVAHIANAGHSIRREQFTPYLQVVQGFLSEVYG